MNILLLNKFFYLKGGSERVFFEEMKVLENHKHKCIPFSRKSLHDAFSKYSPYFPPPLLLSKKSSFHSLKSAVEIVYSQNVKFHLKRLLSNINVDIAHAHNIYGHLTTSVLDVLYLKNIPTIITLHDYKIICPNHQFLRGSEICEDCKKSRYYMAIKNRCVHGSIMYSVVYALENYFNYFTKKYQNKISKFIAVSKFTKNKFIEYGFKEDHIVIIPNFINVHLFEANYRNKKYFLYFGRLSREKGIRTLLKAFHQLKPNGYRLVIVGEGPQREDLEEEVRSSNMQHVEFTGYLSGDLLAEKIKNSTAVVVPSECYENCPMSVLEAMAYGKPVIGADIGGIPELIEDKTDGLIFKSGCADALAEKMDHIASLNNNQIEQMGRSGRQKIEQHYNAERHYESLISLYHDIIH